MEALLSAFAGALRLSMQLFLIIVSLSIFYEFIKAKQQSTAEKQGGFLGISGKGLLPLFTGVIIGLTYGAGVIIHAVHTSGMTKREAFLILLYLSVCHAVIEDTLVFVVIGANGLVLLAARFFLATLFTWLAQKLLGRNVGNRGGE
jgi:hypothetical protein